MIQINKDSDTPRYLQIRDAMQTAIAGEIYKPGMKLPTVAALSKELGVTQATVLRAYEELLQQKIIVSFVGRGTFVNTEGRQQAVTAPVASPVRSPIESASPEFAMAARRLRMGIARSLDDLNILMKRPGLIRFTAGVPDPAIADPQVLERCTLEALTHGQQAFQHYAEAQGLPQLRTCIAERYARKGITISPREILITNGSQQGIALMAQFALENHLRALLETPCYMGIANSFGALGHWVESIPRDAEGPVLERLLRFTDRPGLLYLCPEMHNPMGTDLSAERRTAVVEWAASTQSILLADEIFTDLRLDGPVPASLLADGDRADIVVVGSLSKSFMPGLRIGWLIAPAERVSSLLPLKSAMDLGCPPLMQAIAAALLSSEEYEHHLHKAREHFRLRRDAMLHALAKFMPEGVRWTTPAGGFHLWAELPRGYSSIALYLLAIERGVGFIPGPQLDVDHRFINAFRLSYATNSPEQIEEGIALLADAVANLFQQEPGDPGLSGLGDFL